MYYNVMRNILYVVLNVKIFSGQKYEIFSVSNVERVRSGPRGLLD